MLRVGCGGIRGGIHVGVHGRDELPFTATVWSTHPKPQTPKPSTPNPTALNPTPKPSTPKPFRHLSDCGPPSAVAEDSLSRGVFHPQGKGRVAHSRPFWTHVPFGSCSKSQVSTLSLMSARNGTYAQGSLIAKAAECGLVSCTAI